MPHFVVIIRRVQQNISSKPKTSNINRSESYKERIHPKVRIDFFLMSAVIIPVFQRS